MRLRVTQVRVVSQLIISIQGKSILNYLQLRNKPAQFRSITSLSVEDFDHLLPLFVGQWEYFITRYNLDGSPRNRSYTPRDPNTLATVEEKLFFILAYQKHASVQAFFAAAFDLSQDMANKWIHILSPLLNAALKFYRPARRAEDIPLVANTEYIIDATERPVERDTYEQEEYYSGKQHQHTVKNLLLCSMVGLILYLSPTVYGKIHDKKLADEKLTFSVPAKILADLGFIGYKPPFAIVLLPHKKPKNKELTDVQKDENATFNSRRVLVENCIGSTKIMRCVKDKNRNRKFGYRDQIIETAVSLHNMKLTKKNERSATYSIAS